MEPDRFAANHRMFIIGLVCLLSAWTLIIFSLYLLPHLIFGWHYHIPDFISAWRELFKAEFILGDRKAGWIIVWLFLLPGIICAIIAYRASNDIENQIYAPQNKLPPEESEHEGYGNSASKNKDFFAFKVLGLVLLVFIVLLSIHWIISKPNI